MAVDVVVLAISIPLWLFQFIMMYFLILKGSIKLKEFRSGFYIIFIVLGCMDCMYFLIKLLGVYFVYYKIFLSIFQSDVGILFIIIVSKLSPFCLNFEYFAHALLSFNRYTTFCWIHSHKKIWQGKSLFFIITLLFFFAFLSVVHRVFSPAVVDVSKSGLVAIYDSNASAISVLSGFIVSSISTILELIFELLTCYKIYVLRQSTQNNLLKNKPQEIRLFIYLTICFILHLILTLYYVFFYLNSLQYISRDLFDVSKDVVDITRAVYTNSNSLLLFLISNHVRKEYLMFYKIIPCKKLFTIKTAASTIRVK